jgi:hypothetical protein
MFTASQKHHYLENRLSRFALVTIGRLEEGEARDSIGSEPAFILNGNPVRTGVDEERVIEAARQGVQDAETEFHWSGDRHSVVSLEGLLVDGIDAHAARIAARSATESLIRNQEPNKPVEATAICPQINSESCAPPPHLLRCPTNPDQVMGRARSARLKGRPLRIDVDRGPGDCA